MYAKRGKFLIPPVWVETKTSTWAFVHWYVGEGMEEGEFDDAQDSLQKLQQDYERITDDALDEEEE